MHYISKWRWTGPYTTASIGKGNMEEYNMRFMGGQVIVPLDNIPISGYDVHSFFETFISRVFMCKGGYDIRSSVNINYKYVNSHQSA